MGAVGLSGQESWVRLRVMAHPRIGRLMGTLPHFPVAPTIREIFRLYLHEPPAHEVSFRWTIWRDELLQLDRCGAEPDLSGTALTGLPAVRNDVDGAVAGEGVLDALVHQRPPVERLGG